MRLATIAESQSIDRAAQATTELSAEILMEAAGARAALVIETSFIPEMNVGRGIAILCGPGGNGADGLVVARHLQSCGTRGRQPVRAVLLGDAGKRTELFQVQLSRARLAGVEIHDLTKAPTDLHALLSSQTLLVDAILGLGARREVLQGAFREAVEILNRLPQPVVSLDVPTGLDADRGNPRGVAVKASQTITFGLAKPGFFINEGPAHVGRLRVISFGIAPKLVEEGAKSIRGFGEMAARKSLPRFGAGAHKTDHGHALILAGSPGMWGAGVLAASSSYRMGAGYVTLASSEMPPAGALAETPEVLTQVASHASLWSEHRRWTAAAIGPGLGTGSATAELLKRLLNLPDSRVVVDADAITVAASKGLFPFPNDWVLTPHAGELSRILTALMKNAPSAKEIEADRVEFANEAARLTGCQVLLKGFRTVVATEGRARIVLSGNAALGKAGSGDVLAGMIVALMAQKVPTALAAATAAYVHGRIADDWVRSGQSERALSAGDLRLALPSLLGRLRSSRYDGGVL